MLSVIWPFNSIGMSILLKILLLPITLLYSLLSMIRNLLYDLGILRSKLFDFPVISIGNLSVGGTGKTPHIEYVLNELKGRYKMAVLSRGYMRKTKGFRIVGPEDNATTVGDEPFQIYRKFKNVIVAVDEKRKRGIQKLKELNQAPKLILLDDAFQHRAVKPGLNILLTDYTKPYTDDLPLPSGRLRESRRGARRADLIVVTKSPEVLSPLEIRRLISIINPEPYQKVFFSYIEYQQFIPLNLAAQNIVEQGKSLGKYSIVLVSAIANSKPLLLHLKRHTRDVKSLPYRDHHYFTTKDYDEIKKTFNDVFSNKKAIVITEKDAVKIDLEQFEEIPLFVLPIKIKFHEQGELDFISEIKEHVRSYTKSI